MAYTDIAVFVEDISVLSMLHALVIRSPVSKGSVAGIHTPELPNSLTLITAKDIPGVNELDDFPVPILASETISYTGEAVGLLTGPDLTELETFAAQCLVRIKDKPALQEEASSEEGAFERVTYHSENPREGASAPQLIIDGSYTTGIQEHWYAEPHGAVAMFTGENLTLHTATQWPFHVKRSIAKVLDFREALIEIAPTSLGLHLDGKLWYPSLISCQAALAAYVTQRPVKLMLTREEDFRWSPKRNAAEINLASVLGEKNEVLGTEIRIAAELGGLGVFAREILSQTSLAGLGLYRLGEVNLEAAALKTNTPPQGPFEGFGMSQGFFALERHISRIADSLREDPAEWRKKNSLARNDKLAIGIPLKENVPMTELIDSVAAMSDYYRKWASYEMLRADRRARNLENPKILPESRRGIGIAAAFQGSGLLFPGNDKGAYGVELTLEKDGSLKIKSSILPQSDESSKIWRELAGAILGIGEEAIFISYSPDGPDSGPLCLSRNITAVTRLVERCCHAVRKQRFRDPLPITVRRFSRPQKFSPWNDEKGERNADLSAFSHPAWGAAVTEIEIDHVSFRPKVRGIWLVAEGGKILSQTRARRSLTLGVIHALSWACREQVMYTNGVMLQDITRACGVLSPEEIPPIHIDFLWNNSALPKGIGELPFSCVPASYVQAVSQAVDHPFEKIPLNVRDIWEAELSKKVEIRL